MRGESRKSQRTEIGVYAITRDNNPRTISSVNFNNYGPHTLHSLNREDIYMCVCVCVLEQRDTLDTFSRGGKSASMIMNLHSDERERLYVYTYLYIHICIPL